MVTYRKYLRWLLLSVWMMLSTTEACAHPEGFSGIHVTLASNRVRVAITVHTRDLDGWFPPAKFPDYVSDVTAAMERTVSEIVEVHVDGEPRPVDAVRAFLLEVGLIEIDVDYQLPPSDTPQEVLIWSKHLIRMPSGHQQLLFVEDRRRVQQEEEPGQILLDDVLSVERDAGAVIVSSIAEVSPPSTVSGESMEDEIPESSEPPSVLDEEPLPSQLPSSDMRAPKASPATAEPTSRISFFLFGVEHIITGYDHLLFLAALLLACSTFSQAAAIVTCFTVAHSITLALAALDVVRLSGAVVEPLIALSIVYVAVENLWDGGKSSRWRRAAITCLFGLIHGLGFASALREIGLGTIPGGVLWPLLRFNLGVEAGQLIVAAILLPLILRAQNSDRVAKYVMPAGSLLVALMGAYWLVTRLWTEFAGG